MLLCSLVLQKSIYLFNMVQFNNFNILHLSLKPHDHMIYCEYFSISSYLNILCKCCLIFDEFHRLKLSFTPLQEFCCMLKKCLTLWVQVFTFTISISLSLNSLSDWHPNRFCPVGGPIPFSLACPIPSAPAAVTDYRAHRSSNPIRRREKHLRAISMRGRLCGTHTLH